MMMFPFAVQIFLLLCLLQQFVNALDFSRTVESSSQFWKPSSIATKPTAQRTKHPKHEESFQKYQFPPRGGRSNNPSDANTDVEMKNEIVDLALPSDGKLIHVAAGDPSQQQQQQHHDESNALHHDNESSSSSPPHAVPPTESSEYFIPSTQQQSFSSFYSPFHHSLHRRQYVSKGDEKEMLGRAVLTTPHRRMPAIRIAPGPRPLFLSPQNPGPIYSSTPIYVTKSTICKSLNCALRDLRIIDQCGRYYSGPAFLARRNCIIVNVGHVRAIVMRDQVIIFLPWDQQQQSQQSTSISSNNFNNNNTGEDNEDVTHVINNLVDALVMHLNSIYHSGNHLVMEEVTSLSPTRDFGHSSGQYLTSRYDTSMGHLLGSEWYQDQIGTSSQSNENMKKKHQKKKRKHISSKTHNGKENKDDKDQLSKTPRGKAPPFELVVIEALLGHVCSQKSSTASNLIQTAKEVLSGITYTDNSSNQKRDAFLEMQRKLGQLLPLKNKVDELEAKCTEVASAIAEVLKNDEDMAAMRLSEIAALRELNEDFVISSLDEGDPYNLHVEVELLFEDYLLQMDEVLHSLRSIQSSITNTEEVVEIELDLLRNRIMRYEMLLELSGLVVGVAAAVTGAFGMNLVNHFEEHPRMFYEVSLGLVVFMIGMGYALLKKLSMDSIL